MESVIQESGTTPSISYVDSYFSSLPTDQEITLISLLINFQPLPLNQIQLQWKPVNVITVNVIRLVIVISFPRTICYITVHKILGLLLSHVITFEWSKSDHIKQIPLHVKI